MDTLDARIAQWRAHVERGRAVDGPDVEELETHLRDQVADLEAVGLSDDEAFLVAIRRMGDLDTLSREFAREHHERLWKQLVLATGADRDGTSPRLADALVLAGAAAVAIQVPRVFGLESLLTADPGWYLRNASLLVLPFLAWFFVRRSDLSRRGRLVTATPFLVAAALVNVPPWANTSATQLLVALHLPVVLWFAVAYPYMGGTWRSHHRRMDFVRFTGEWCIYYALIALGGAVLVGLSAFVFEPVGPGAVDDLVGWVLPSGAAGAVVVAAWLVETKQAVVENMAPVLTMVFTPLFAAMLLASAITYLTTGLATEFNREVLGVFDALLVVVLGLVLYATSARHPRRPPGLMDHVQLVAVVSALVLDLVVLTAMVARIGDLGLTPNRVAALGLNLVLLANLARAAWLATRFLAGRTGFHDLERWQTAYLPVFGAWATVVVTALPLVFTAA